MRYWFIERLTQARRAALVASLVCAVSALHAQSGVSTTISKLEWKAVLRDNTSSSELISLTEDLSKEAGRLAGSGKRAEALKAAVKALALAKVAHTLSPSLTSSDNSTLTGSNEQLAETLKAAGVSAAAIEQSTENLRSVLASSHETTSGRREQLAVRAAVRSSLKDPESAKFGALVFVRRDRACQTVNAKNSYGGYAGDHQALVMKRGEAWSSLTTFDSLAECVYAANVP